MLAVYTKNKYVYCAQMCEFAMDLASRDSQNHIINYNTHIMLMLSRKMDSAHNSDEHGCFYL